MKIIVFADIHYFAGTREQYKSTTKLVHHGLPVFKALIKKINEEHKPDFCVNLGDSIQDLNDKQKDLAALKEVSRLTDTIECPCYTIFGNHDLKMMDTVSEVEALFVGKKSTFSFDKDGYHFIFLTTEIRSELGLERGGGYKAWYLSQSDMEWLREDLAKNDLPYMIFAHYPLAEDSTVDDCFLMKNRDEIKQMLKGDKNLLAVMAGHQHSNQTYLEDNVLHINLGSTITCRLENGIPEGTYAEIILENGNMTVYYRQVKVEEEI